MTNINKLKQLSVSTIQNLSEPMASIAVRLQMFSPEWSLVIGMGAGLLAVYRELAEDRGSELFREIEEHKEEFIESIVKSQDFKATLLNVWEMHIRENSQEKRRRLRKFLLALGKGEKIDNDLHTKIYSTIEQMTDEEAEVFGLIIKNSNRDQFRKMHLNHTSIPELKEYPEEKIRDNFHSLHSYRLINTSEATMGGIMLITQITPFGASYYDHILSAE